MGVINIKSIFTVIGSIDRDSTLNNDYGFTFKDKFPVRDKKLETSRNLIIITNLHIGIIRCQ